MKKVTVRMPMHRRDPETGAVQQTYATYEGHEVMVPFEERVNKRTARLFSLKNKRDEEYELRITGNGQYALTKKLLGDRPIAMGTMMDAVTPEIIV